MINRPGCKTLRSEVGLAALVGTPHWWACSYGPHPQQIIIAEQAVVASIDMRVSMHRLRHAEVVETFQLSAVFCM